MNWMPPPSVNASSSDGIEQRSQHVEARLGRGVVGGFLMIAKLDFFMERVRHCGAMRRDMRQMAARQPQFGQRGQRQRGDENEGELRSSHMGVISVFVSRHGCDTICAYTVQLADARIMAQNQNYLIWIDMEMTGLVPDTDRVIEVALVITDNNLETIAEAPVLVVHQPDSVLDGMDAWNKSTHAKSGLIDKVKASTLDEAMVEEQMVEFLKEYVPIRTSPMCGNSICQDRRFLARWMPKLEGLFPLPQSRREHAQGTGQALETGYGAGGQKARQARGAGRYLRIDQRDEALPGAFHQALKRRLPSWRILARHVLLEIMMTTEHLFHQPHPTMTTARVIERPDGFYWQDEAHRQSCTVLLPRCLKRYRTCKARSDSDFEEGESLEDAEAEIGISTWIDPETGEPAEGLSPRTGDD